MEAVLGKGWVAHGLLIGAPEIKLSVQPALPERNGRVFSKTGRLMAPFLFIQWLQKPDKRWCDQYFRQVIIPDTSEFCRLTFIMIPPEVRGHWHHSVKM